MKLLITSLTLMLSLSAFAQDGYDKMDVLELFQRGYALKTTIVQERGIMIEKDKRTVELGACTLWLHKHVKENSIIKTGRSFLLTQINTESTESFRAMDSNDQMINAISYYMSPAYRGITITLKTITENCGKAFKFEVVENTTLQEI